MLSVFFSALLLIFWLTIIWFYEFGTPNQHFPMNWSWSTCQINVSNMPIRCHRMALCCCKIVLPNTFKHRHTSFHEKEHCTTIKSSESSIQHFFLQNSHWQFYWIKCFAVQCIGFSLTLHIFSRWFLTFVYTTHLSV